MIKTAFHLGAVDNNAYLIVDESTNFSALVDCPDASPKMLELIGNTKLKYILLTHGHFDHIEGVKEISEKFGAKVVISKEDAPMLENTKLSLGAFCNVIHPTTKADIIVDDGDVISVGNIDIDVIKTPGHTEGGVCYKMDGALFTGDTLFHLSCGRTDLPGGSYDVIKESLKKLKSISGEFDVYPGHDSLSTLSFEKQNNPYMKNL